MSEFFLTGGWSSKKIFSALVIILSTSFVLGGMIETGSIGYADGSNSLQTIIPLGIFFYLSLIVGLTLAGFNLKKHELIVIPLVGALIILFFFTKIINPSYDITPEGGANLTSDKLIDLSSTITSVPVETSTASSISTISTSLPPESNQNFLDYRFLFLFSLLALLFTALLVLIYSRARRVPIRIQFAEEEKYSGKYNQFQKSIMEIYIQLSYLLENRFGRAPKWYSPTRFSKEIYNRVFSTLAQNWDEMTRLYERARFGHNAVGEDDVELAKELEMQITGLLERLKEMEARR